MLTPDLQVMRDAAELARRPTLRTQLDIFQKMIPELAGHFTVYACDYPGHGWSDIPRADYAPEDFYRWTSAFLDRCADSLALIKPISVAKGEEEVRKAKRAKKAKNSFLPSLPSLPILLPVCISSKEAKLVNRSTSASAGGIHVSCSTKNPEVSG